MAAGVRTQAAGLYAKRARGVWLVIGLSTLLFCVACASAATGIYGYLSGVTKSEHAHVQLIRGSQLVVKRYLRVEPEAVEKSTTINEGDTVSTGPDTEANIDVFDGSTIHAYFNTKVLLESMRTNRFLRRAEDVKVSMQAGTAVVSTAGDAEFSSAQYVIITPNSVVETSANSTVRIQIEGVGDSASTRAVVTFGSVVVAAGGRREVLDPGEMTEVAAGGAPTEARAAEQELVQNGSFSEPPTSGRELAENGGLGTAAWLPFREQQGDPLADPSEVTGTVQITEETLAGQTVRAVVLNRDGVTNRYGRLGIRQDLNAPAAFLRNIELHVALKIVSQTQPVAGPQGDVYPFNVRVLYQDADGRSHEWRQSFYTGATSTSPRNASVVPLGSWHQHPQLAGSAGATDDASRYLLKGCWAVNGVQACSGQDVSVINAIEIYGVGSNFQSWVTNVSLLAR